MNRKLRIASLLVAALAVAPLLSRANGDEPKLLQIGDPVGDLVLTDLDGKTVKSADLKGKVVVLSLFALS
jgi:cytochrome oxidase Cu insertion factor (SCO1/SenC/PrrC family)